MRLLRVLQDHPVVVLAVVLAGFGGWVAANLPGRPDRPTPPADPMFPPLVMKELPAPLGVCTPANLAQLRPGMTRVEVEGLIGAPPPDHVLPVGPDRSTYLTAYPARFTAPVQTFDRLRALPPLPDSGVRVAVEFDATRPGHPLVRVYYPDPLF